MAAFDFAAVGNYSEHSRLCICEIIGLRFGAECAFSRRRRCGHSADRKHAQHEQRRAATSSSFGEGYLECSLLVKHWYIQTGGIAQVHAANAPYELVRRRRGSEARPGPRFWERAAELARPSGPLAGGRTPPAPR